MKCYDVNIRKYILLKCIKRIIYYMIFFLLGGDCAVMLHVCAVIMHGHVGRGDVIFGHSDLHFWPWLGIQYKFTEYCKFGLIWAGISLWLGCARILVLL